MTSQSLATDVEYGSTRMRSASRKRNPVKPTQEQPNDIRFLSTLLSLSKSTRALAGLHLSGIGLNVGQDQLLDVLEPGVQLAVSVAADRLNVRPSTISKMVDRLVEKGLMERCDHEGDGRCTCLKLTQAGEAKREAVHALWDGLETSLIRTDMLLAEPEIGAAMATVDRALKKRLARLR